MTGPGGKAHHDRSPSDRHAMTSPERQIRNSRPWSREKALDGRLRQRATLITQAPLTKAPNDSNATVPVATGQADASDGTN